MLNVSFNTSYFSTSGPERRLLCSHQTLPLDLWQVQGKTYHMIGLMLILVTSDWLAVNITDLWLVVRMISTSTSCSALSPAAWASSWPTSWVTPSWGPSPRTTRPRSGNTSVTPSLGESRAMWSYANWKILHLWKVKRTNCLILGIIAGSLWSTSRWATRSCTRWACTTTGRRPRLWRWSSSRPRSRGRWLSREITRYVIGQLMTMLDADWSILQGWYHRADLAKFARQRQAMMRGNADTRGHQLED